MLGVVAVGRQDLLGCLEERVGGQSISLGECWVDLLACGDDLVEESDIWRWVVVLATHLCLSQSQARERLTFIRVVGFIVLLAAAAEK
jgi:hypothetical protein